MIDKRKLQDILSGNQQPASNKTEEYSENVSTQNITRNERTQISVIICNQENQYYYDELSLKRKDLLICSEIRYLNSINHIEGVKNILIDYSSFSDEKEIVFLMKVFSLLHRDATLIICKTSKESLNKMVAILNQNNIQNTFMLNKENLQENFEEGMSEIEIEPLTVKSKSNKKRTITYFMITILVAFLIGVATLCVYGYFSNNKEVLHNRNMNVQLNMESSVILPINVVYSDKIGNHIVVEENGEGESRLEATLFDENKKEIMVDIRKGNCPDNKCNHHFELIFKDNSVDYYILQISNQTVVRNIEIDKQYFK